jgi:UDP-glucose 4-epimerase
MHLLFFILTFQDIIVCESVLFGLEDNYIKYRNLQRFLSCHLKTPAADPTLARQALGWHPQHSDLRTLIEHAWRWETRGT